MRKLRVHLLPKFYVGSPGHYKYHGLQVSWWRFTLLFYWREHE